MDSISKQDLESLTVRMLALARRFATPIAKHMDDYGEHWGTGGFVDHGGKALLLSNEHVLKPASSQYLYRMRGSTDLIPITGHAVCAPHPADVAMVGIPPETWAARPTASDALTLGQIAAAHATVERELLFLYGFAGSRSKFLYGELHNEGTGFLCQEHDREDLPDAFQRLTTDATFNETDHFAIDYKPDLATNVVANSGLPLPPGMSGSLVWNTRYMEITGAGEEWTEDAPVVTGLVWGWHSSAGVLVATKAEHIREFVSKFAVKA